MRRFGLFLIAALASVSLFAAPTQYVITAAGQGPGSTSFASAIPAAGGTVVYDAPAIGVVIATSDAPNFAATMTKVQGVQFATPDMDVQWISPNEQSAPAPDGVAVPEGLNSEPYYALGYQWNIRQIRADAAAANGNLGDGAVVAVLDAGCNMNHLDIKENILSELAKSFVPGEGVLPVQVGTFNHGTHVSGIIAAGINNRGIQGVAPKAKIIPVKVLPESGSGSFGWLIQGLDYIASLNRSGEAHVDIANMSLGATFDRNNAGGGGAGPLIAALNRAINGAEQAGILCVSAAGNEGVDLNSRLWSIPAQSGHGIAVSATGPIRLADFERLASYSNYGRSVVNVGAPGGDYVGGIANDMIIAPGSAVGSSGYWWAAGTSMAAPAASGVAALIVGRYGHMSATELKTRLEAATVITGPESFFGKGRIDALKATSN